MHNRWQRPLLHNFDEKKLTLLGCCYQETRLRRLGNSWHNNVNINKSLFAALTKTLTLGYSE